MLRTVVCVALLAVLFFLVNAPPALAYIDPNVGGMLFQVLATAFAVLSGVALVFSRQIRMAVARVGRFLRGRFARGGQSASEVQGPEVEPSEPG